MKRTINSQSSLSDLIGELRQLFKEKKYFQISINTGKKRSLDQNAIGHVWYAQVEKEEKEYTASEVKCLCKLWFGVPILRGDDEEFNVYCVTVLDPMTYEAQVALMLHFRLTSLMDTGQKSRYLEAIQKHYIGRVELLFPEDG